MPAESDIVITGAGLVCCLGLDRHTAWRGVVEGRAGMRGLTAIESALEPNIEGGQATELSNTASEGFREIGFLRLALQQALTEALSACVPLHPAPRCGIIVGTTLHGMRSGGRFLRTGDVSALSRFLSGGVLRSATQGLGVEGFSTTVCSACSSGLASVAMGITLLRSGFLDLVLAGGYDPISEYSHGGFSSMRLVTAERIRPFSRHRAGMKLGEGYAIVALERAEDARRRGATPLARIAGFGEGCDAFHLSRPHPEGVAAARAIQQALDAAGIVPGDVSLIAAHATATPDNDAAEFQALKRVFGENLASVPVVAFKSHLGHTLGGAGTVELILSVSALRDQLLPACANVDANEVEFAGLQLATGKTREARLQFVLNISLGFGGSNVSVVVGKPRVPKISETGGVSAHDREVLITGVGIVLPGAIGNGQFLAMLERGDESPHFQDAGGLEQMDLEHLLNARRVRRMSDYVKLTLAATSLAYQDAHIVDVEAFGEDCCGVLATTHGATGFCEKYYRQLVQDGLDSANPVLFAEGVPNVAGAHLGTTMSIRGLSQTVIGTRTAGIDALILASCRLRTGVWTRAVVCAADECVPIINQAYAHFGLYRGTSARAANRKCPGFVTGCGAVALILERSDFARARGASPRGIVRETAGAFKPPLATRLGVAAIGRVVAEIGHPAHLVGSVNATWLDRVELAGILAADRAGRSAQRQPTIVAGIYGHVAECFSANALAGLASVLVSGRLPSWRAGWHGPARVATGHEKPDTFGVLATDYSGAVSGLHVQAVNAGPRV